MTPRPDELPRAWRDRADQLRRWAQAEGAATAWLAAAAELEAALHEAADVPLTLAEAASESGFSTRRLQQLLADGSLPNAGKPGRPRIRRCDLPRKARKGTAGSYDPAAHARHLLAS